MPAGKDTSSATASKATKTPKTPKTPKAAKAAAAPVVVEEAAAAAPAADVAVDATADTVSDTWCASTELEALINEFSELRSNVSAALTKLRDFKKNNDRQIKKLLKTQAKKKASNAQRKPSGFTKPTPITPELAKFLGKPAGTEMARTDVTKEINAYIQTHKLQDEANGRQINPDKKLATLLNVKKDDVLTYFNLQRFMSPHFIKVKAEASA